MSRRTYAQMWQHIDHLEDVIRKMHAKAHERNEEIKRLKIENAKLRDSLKALMMGTYAELCDDRGEQQCRECAMRRGDDTCVTADAMELLGIDMYGEPLGGTDG